MQTKEIVRQLLERLPDDCTLEEVLYHLNVAREVESGVTDADAGRTVPHDQVAKTLREKWQLGAAG